MGQTWNFPMASTATLSDSRSYLNDSCASLQSSFSGTSPPGSAVAGQLYFNTSTKVFSVYGSSQWWPIFTASSNYGGLLPLSATSSYPLSGDLYCGVTNQIKGLANPSDANDAVTLTYLQTNYLKLVGGTMGGAIDMGANLISCTATPTADSHLARKAYVDLHVEKAGDTMTGDLSFGTTKTCTNLVAPSAAGDAATKSYVDDEFDPATGHDHDGTDAKRVDYSDLVASGVTVGQPIQTSADDIVVTRDCKVGSVAGQVGVLESNYETMATVSVTLEPNERRLLVFGFWLIGLANIKWRLKRDSTTLIALGDAIMCTGAGFSFAYMDTYATGGAVTYELEAYGNSGTSTWSHAYIHAV